MANGKHGFGKSDEIGGGPVIHGVSVGQVKVGQDELSSPHRSPMKALGEQHVGGPGERNPKGMGRSVAKQEMSKEKEKLSEDY